MKQQTHPLFFSGVLVLGAVMGTAACGGSSETSDSSGNDAGTASGGTAAGGTASTAGGTTSGNGGSTTGTGGASTGAGGTTTGTGGTATGTGGAPTSGFGAACTQTDLSACTIPDAGGTFGGNFGGGGFQFQMTPCCTTDGTCGFEGRQGTCVDPSQFNQGGTPDGGGFNFGSFDAGLGGSCSQNDLSSCTSDTPCCTTQGQCGTEATYNGNTFCSPFNFNGGGGGGFFAGTPDGG